MIGSSTNDARRAASEFGADLALDTREAGFADAVLGATGGKGWTSSWTCCRGRCGADHASHRDPRRMVNVGALRAQRPSSFDLHALRRIDYIGVTFRTRTLEEVPKSTAACAPICGRR